MPPVVEAVGIQPLYDELWARPIVDLVIIHEGLADTPAPSTCEVGGALACTADRHRVARCALFHDLAHVVTGLDVHGEALFAKQFELMWFYGEPGDIEFCRTRNTRRGYFGVDEGLARFRRRLELMDWIVATAAERVAYEIDSLCVAV